MLTEYAVFASRTPICSAIDMNRLLNTSSITGSTRRAERVARRARHVALEHEVVRAASPRRCQPGSTTVVALRSAMIAGPAMRVAGREVLARGTPARRAKCRRCTSGPLRQRRRGARAAASPAVAASLRSGVAPTASTETASTISARSGIRNAEALAVGRLELPRASPSASGSGRRSAPCRCRRTCSARGAARAIRSGGMPWPASSARAARQRAARARRCTSGSAFGRRAAPRRPARASRVTSARPMP